MKSTVLYSFLIFASITLALGCGRKTQSFIHLNDFVWIYSNHRPGVDYEYAELNFRDSIVIVRNSLQNEQYKVVFFDDGRMFWNGVEVLYSFNLRDTTLRTRLHTNEVLYKGLPKEEIEENYVVRMARDMIDIGPEGNLPPEVLEAYQVMIWNSYFPNLGPVDSLAHELDLD